MMTRIVLIRRVCVGATVWCACLASAVSISAAVLDVVDMTTAISQGTVTDRTLSTPAGTTIHYDGTREAITDITTTGGQVWAPTDFGQVAIRRNTATQVFPTSNPNQTVAWFKEAPPETSEAAIDVKGEYVTDMTTLFNSSSVVRGSDNIFANEGNTSGNNHNIERIDFIFSDGLTASDALGFLIMERGVANAHDAFKVSIITGLVGGPPARIPVSCRSRPAVGARRPSHRLRTTTASCVTTRPMKGN